MWKCICKPQAQLEGQAALSWLLPSPPSSSGADPFNPLNRTARLGARALAKGAWLGLIGA